MAEARLDQIESILQEVAAQQQTNTTATFESYIAHSNWASVSIAKTIASPSPQSNRSRNNSTAVRSLTSTVCIQSAILVPPLPNVLPQTARLSDRTAGGINNSS